MPYLKAPASNVPRPTTGSKCCWAAVVLTASLLAGCTTGGVPTAAVSAVPPRSAASAPAAATLAAAEVAYGASPKSDASIAYQRDVVLVGGGASAVESVSADGMIWTIKGTAAHVADLQPGKVMLASGLGAGRILAVTTVGGNRQVVLGPVDITDVVRDGNFDSTAPVPLDSALAYATPTRPGLLSSTDENPAVTPTDSAAAPTPVSAAGSSVVSSGGVAPGPSVAPGSVPAPGTAPDTTAPSISAPSVTAPSVSAPSTTAPSTSPPAGSGQVTPATEPGGFRLPTVEFGAAVEPADFTAAHHAAAIAADRLPAPAVPGSGVLPLPVSTPATDDVGAYALTSFCCAGGAGVKLSYDHAGMRVSATLTLHLSGPSVAFRLHIAGGKVTEAAIELHGAAGIGIQFNAASTAGVKGNVARQRVQVPVAFTVPIGGFALPLTARVEQTFSLSTAFASPGSISATGDYSFGGTLGFGIHGLTQTVTNADNFATQTSLLDSIQAVGIAPVALEFGYQAKLTVGLGLLGFSAGAWLSLVVRIGVTAASSEAAVPCRLAAINAQLGYGIGYQIPTPVAKLVNFFLTTFGAPPIRASGGITGPYQSIVDKSATQPDTASCH